MTNSSSLNPQPHDLNGLSNLERLPRVYSRWVVDDDAAIDAFLRIYRKRSLHTIRSYRMEVRRFLLWLRVTRPFGAALLPAVTPDDINDYQELLSNPREFSIAVLREFGWRHQPFRKLEGLSDAAISHAITILYQLFAALKELPASKDRAYCQFNPVHLANKTVTRVHKKDEVERALTSHEWFEIQATIGRLPRDTSREMQHYHRARWIFNLLYRAFLRRSEASALTMSNFEQSHGGWVIRIRGKGGKMRRIVASDRLIDELKLYREFYGLTPLPKSGETCPAIMRLGGNTDQHVTPQTIYLVCTTIAKMTADHLQSTDPAAAKRFLQTSPHWMRHTGISHAMEAGVSPRYVQAQARHSSLVTTAIYDHKDRDAWRSEIERMDRR